MKIVTVQFQYPDFYDFVLLRDVFKESCRIHMPDVEFISIDIPPPEKIKGKARNFKYNTTKLRIWKEYMDIATEPVIFSDCDMLAMKDASPAFDIDFDVAYTARTRVNRIPMNGGIVFANPTEGARLFFSKWLEINNQMLADTKFHSKWRSRYAGMNQAAFGYLYEELYKKNQLDLKLHKYLTIDWNAVDCDWVAVNERTHFVHFKSKLRQLVLSGHPITHHYAVIMNAWYDVMRGIRPDMPRPHSVPFEKLKVEPGPVVYKRRKYKSKAGTRKIKV